MACFIVITPEWCTAMVAMEEAEQVPWTNVPSEGHKGDHPFFSIWGLGCVHPEGERKLPVV